MAMTPSDRESVIERVRLIGAVRYGGSWKAFHDGTGVKRWNTDAWKRGYRPSARLCGRIAKATGVRPGWILYRTGPADPGVTAGRRALMAYLAEFAIRRAEIPESVAAHRRARACRLRRRRADLARVPRARALPERARGAARASDPGAVRRE